MVGMRDNLLLIDRLYLIQIIVVLYDFICKLVSFWAVGLQCGFDSVANCVAH